MRIDADDVGEWVANFLLFTMMTAGVLAALVLWGIAIYGAYKGLEWLL